MKAFTITPLILVLNTYFVVGLYGGSRQHQIIKADHRLLHPRKVIHTCVETHLHQHGNSLLETWVIPPKLREKGYKGAEFEFILRERKLNCEDFSEYSINITAPSKLKFFTSNGYFRRGARYYPPQSFCIHRFTETKITIKACLPNCGNGDVCLPKCCPVGWVIARDLKESILMDPVCIPQKSHWSPFLYRRVGNETGTVSDFDLIEHPKKPFYTEGFPTCEYRRISFSTHPLSTNLFHYEIIILDTGQVLFRRRGSTGAWRERKTSSSDFCIDGLLEMGENSHYVRHWSNQIMFKCFKPKDVYERNRDSILKVVTAVRFITSFLLLVTVLVYLLLWKEQNFHGWTIATFCFCTGIEHAFDGLAFGFIFWNKKFIATTGCFLMSIAHHFFNIATYSWMIILSYDMWVTIGSMIPLSQRSKGGKRFIKYCLFGFGLPSLMISVFVIIDMEAIESSTNIIRPEYGRHICAVSFSAYLYYLISVDLLLYLFNLGFSLMCMKTYVRMKQGVRTARNKRASSKSSSSIRTRKKKRQFWLLGKLFIIMGIFLLVELIIEFIPGSVAAWFRVFFIALHCLRDFGIFWIFTCTKHVQQQLWVKGCSALSSF